jgi:hypothetical protein
MVKNIGFQSATTPKPAIYNNFKVGSKIIQSKTLPMKNVVSHP